ncbi:hypothetical protein RZA67_04055 [Stenotrophomonas sp. C3(2023)]|uniref:hypothetical protein n=1 Tax=Stenotrophomonas sp. C3(2023) TaxID=3080277 RepID=UPI00293C58E9|nr:hypothetical protein [Stenotrophomonas sp. C3(2023)]MDV3467906.1 hypothetical protein [Stenotrophomonas sp. C3(2023)]
MRLLLPLSLSLLLGPLLLTACSRSAPTPLPQREEVKGAEEQARARRDRPDAVALGGTTPGAEPSRTAPGATGSPGRVVRDYVAAVLRRDADAIGRYWQHDSNTRDDAALHALTRVQRLRVTTDAPIVRDDPRQGRLLEVPVVIRAATAHGSFTYRGWYRLVPGPGGDGWLIQSAQLQPALQ